MTRWEAGEAISLGETVMGRSPTRLEYHGMSWNIYIYIYICWNIRQDPCYFTFSMGGYLPCEFASDSKMYQKRFRRRMIREAAGRYSSAFSWTF